MFEYKRLIAHAEALREEASIRLAELNKKGLSTIGKLLYNATDSQKEALGVLNLKTGKQVYQGLLYEAATAKTVADLDAIRERAGV